VSTYSYTKCLDRGCNFDVRNVHALYIHPIYIHPIGTVSIKSGDRDAGISTLNTVGETSFVIWQFIVGVEP